MLSNRKTVTRIVRPIALFCLLGSCATGPVLGRPTPDDLFLFAWSWYQEDVGPQSFDYLPPDLICTLECLCSPSGRTIWFVDNTAPEGGDGSLPAPFHQLKLAEDASSAGHTIFIFEGDGTPMGLDEGIALKDDQILLGEAVGLTVGGTPVVPPGGFPTLTNTMPDGNGIDLANGNLIAGLRINETMGSGIDGVGVSIGTIGSVTITNALDRGIDLDTCSGTFELNGVDIVNASKANLSVTGGDANVDIGSASPCSIRVTQASASALLVDGTHTGTLTLNPNSAVSATSGDGLQFLTANGTYSFDGAVTLNEGDAGIDILNNSAGTFTFSPNTSITNPSGAAVNIQNFASGARFDYDGDITGNLNTIFSIDSTEAGTVINFNRNGSNALRSTGNPFGAFFIFDGDGDINLTTPAMVEDPEFSSLFATDGDGTWTFTDLTIVNQRGLNGGIDVFGSAGTVTFDNLNITTESADTGHAATGFLAGGNNVVNVTGSSSVNANGGGALVLINVASVDMTFQHLTSTNNTNDQIGFAGDDGIDLLEVDGGSLEVTGTTTVKNASGEGISIENVGASATFANVDIDGVGRDGITAGVVFDVTGAVHINGGSIRNTGRHGIRVGSSVSGSGAADFKLNNTDFSGIGESTASIANSTVAGSGNTAVPFSCNDGGGNTGAIGFNGGADTCP